MQRLSTFPIASSRPGSGDARLQPWPHTDRQTSLRLSASEILCSPLVSTAGTSGSLTRYAWRSAGCLARRSMTCRDYFAAVAVPGIAMLACASARWVGLKTFPQECCRPARFKIEPSKLIPIGIDDLPELIDALPPSAVAAHMRRKLAPCEPIDELCLGPLLAHPLLEFRWCRTRRPR